MQAASLTTSDAGGGQKDGVPSGCRPNRRLPRQVLLECLSMFNRRLIISFLIILGLFVTILIRLVRLQAFDYPEHRSQVEELLVRSPVLLPSIRGRILDRNGKLLADNVPCFDIGIHYGAISMDEKYIQRLASNRARAELGEYEQKVRSHIQQTWLRLPKLLELPPEVIRQRRSQITNKIRRFRADAKARLRERQQRLRDSWLQDAQAQAISQRIASLVLREELAFMPIAFGVENDEARHIQTEFLSPEWLALIPTTRRVYPYRYVAAQTIGSVGTVQADDKLYRQHRLDSAEGQPADPFRGYAPEGDTIGRNGVELGYEWQILRGTRGLRQEDRNGNLIPGGNVRPKPGADLHLTIDIELQQEMELAMPSESAGAAVVIDIKTSQVLALVSTPLLPRSDSELPEVAWPNHRPPFIDGTNPWMNRAVEARYPPGSTVKPLVILAAMSEIDGSTNSTLIKPNTIHYCDFGHSPAPSCGNHAHGQVDPRDAIKRSCNVFCAATGKLLSTSLLIWFSDFGLARHTPLNLPRENDGTLPGVASHRFGVLRRLPDSEARQIAIGQGKLTVTPLHVANMMATIARRGLYKSPRLTAQQKNLPDPVQLICDPQAMDLVLDAMNAVVNEPGGTAYSIPELRALGFTVAGKTGTAQYRPGLEDWRCWFAGFAPARDPQIAFAVVIEHGESGARVAGPVAARLLKLCEKHGYINPSALATH